MLLTRENLLKKRPRRTKVINLPELEGEVTIRAMTEGERSRYEASFLTKDGKPQIRSIEAARRLLIVLTVIDEQGHPMLTEQDLTALAEQDASALSRIYNASRDLSGFEESDIEELVKNSAAPNADAPPSASPHSVDAGTPTN